MADGLGPVLVKPMRILHVLRAPLGGLFRHVCDLTEGQRKAGHKVGVICGDVPGDPVSMVRLGELARQCELGIHVIPMHRMPGVADAANMLRMMSRARLVGADVIHGHGAKGGAYARLLPRFAGGVRIYTPHGGALHFDRRNVRGFAFLAAERLLRRRTDGFIFESDFGLRTFIDKVGDPDATSTVIHNGVTETEFAPVTPNADAADFVFIGELRELKGVGTLIDAATLAGEKMHLRIVGSGDMRAFFEAVASHVPPQVKIEFMGAMPARKAFALGRTVVVPSYHESLPYIVLEAAAAGLPVIATRVGGMAEIFGPDASTLLTPRDIGGLADRLRHALHNPDEMAALAERLRARVRAEFTAPQMVDGVLAFYRALLDMKSTVAMNEEEAVRSRIERAAS
ncbi:MAG: glycosyltransferase family 4 protein [Parvibaculum sp.]|uniref:glycosyltransferase family 4 protein n=1 Tax=Parvibaculum sp. TaxID=2024848 RepID=UPI0025EBA4C8|nr:glycosyltransferase family 4 protein [Parvibaculum sp.]MCE9649350.1 glycosyltransferase family 4 protein [Parvibaculum sp.]